MRAVDDEDAEKMARHDPCHALVTTAIEKLDKCPRAMQQPKRRLEFAALVLEAVHDVQVVGVEGDGTHDQLLPRDLREQLLRHAEEPDLRRCHVPSSVICCMEGVQGEVV